MTDDIFDMIGAAKKRKQQKEEAEQQQSEDALDFLGSFKKKMTSGESSKPAEQAGVTPLDIADLPEDQKRIMFSMLRDQKASSDGVTLDELQEQLGAEESLTDTLTQLADEEWLVVAGTPPNERYKVNLRRKRGRLRGNIWSALE
ncbi:MAG: hypothetical protein H6673_13050 [Anaerolineales bacterium]|nr:hypothetical protein [Anaerolineales bacterium]